MIRSGFDQVLVLTTVASTKCGIYNYWAYYKNKKRKTTFKSREAQAKLTLPITNSDQPYKAGEPEIILTHHHLHLI